MKKKEKSKTNYWGLFIILFLIYQLIKFGIQNDWFVNKQKNNSRDNKFSGNLCESLSLSKIECKNLNKKLEEFRLDNENKSLSSEIIPHKS